jgi:hypothetical protein
MEAPRGPRPIFDGCHYNAAWKMSPTASMFPCTDCRGNCRGHCGTGQCSTGNCGGDSGNVGNGYTTGGGLAQTQTVKPTPQPPVDPKVKRDLPPASQTPTVTPGFTSLMPPGDAGSAPRTDPPAPVFLPAVTPGSK